MHVGSILGRHKRLNESFQAGAGEPLGTDSYWTISKRSSEYWLLIGHKNALYYWAQSANSIYSRVTEWVSLGRLLSRHSGQVRSPWLCVQGKLSFSTLLTRLERTTDQSKTHPGYNQYSSNSICSEKTLLTDHKVLSIIGSLKCSGDDKVKKAQLDKVKQQLCICNMLFLYIFSPSLLDYHLKITKFYVLWRTWTNPMEWYYITYWI